MEVEVPRDLFFDEVFGLDEDGAPGLLEVQAGDGGPSRRPQLLLERRPFDDDGGQVGPVWSMGAASAGGATSGGKAASVLTAASEAWAASLAMGMASGTASPVWSPSHAVIPTSKSPTHQDRRWYAIAALIMDPSPQGGHLETSI